MGGADYIAFHPKDLFSDNFKTEFYEIKTKNDRMSKFQKLFANMIVNMGAEYFIVKEKNNDFEVTKWN